jgi:hypothetical protein
MKLRRIISISATLLGLVILLPLRALQTEDATKVVTKKAKKAAKSSADAAPANTAAATEKIQTKDAETTKAASNAVKKTSPAPAKSVSDSEIAAAKADGKVWVNTDTGVYHKGGKWFGATKQGRFMTEQDAKAAGYRASKAH